MTPTFYYTVTRNEIRPFMPTVPVLVSAAGWVYKRRSGKFALRPPPLPDHVVERGADCGGFVAATRWGGHYRFTPDEYVSWLMKWRPQWAAAMDMPCLDAATWGYPGKEEVERRQRYTTEMAFHFWATYAHLPIEWCVTIQGYHPEEYARHAGQLAPLIQEMCEIYLDSGWADEEQEQQPCAFRVGIGSLCGRDPAAVHAIIEVVQSVIGLYPLHLWGTKLKFLQSPQDPGGVLSVDSAAWNGLRGPTHEARRQSGLSEAQFCWQVSHPSYARRVATALCQPKFVPLISCVTLNQRAVQEAQAAGVPLSEELCYRCSGQEPGE